MNASSRPLTAAVLSLGVGFAWWAAYTPLVMPLGWILAAHLVAGLALERALHAVRLRGFATPVFSILYAAALVPWTLSTVHQAGLVGGKTAALVDLGAMALGAGLGALVGELWHRRRKASFWLNVFTLAIAGVLWSAAAGRIPVDGPPPGAVSAAIPTKPLAILGIDGADWRVMEPMIARGELPTLAGLRTRGRHGVLRSLQPMASPVVWTSIFTGQPPAVHGLSDWDRSDDRSRRVPTLWDIYGAGGRSSLTVNVPGSWPPHAVPNGRMISGFPLPGLSSGDKGHLMGVLIDSAGEGSVHTVRPVRDGEAWTATVSLAQPDIAPRVPHFSHAVLDAARREGLLPIEGFQLALRVLPTGDGARVEGDFAGEPLALRVGEWSRWLRISLGTQVAWTRVALVRADADGMALFVSPPFQDPIEPKLPFASGVLDESTLKPEGAPYVVEGLGWTAHRDPRVAPLVPSMILDVQATQTRAVAAALRAQVPTLTAWVFTATDRLQHPFWALHDGSSYGGFQPPAGLAGSNPVEEAYRAADAALAEILALLPAETLVFVVSDHGADPADGRHEHGEAGHRDAGIWIAVGPDIPADPTPVELSVLDVVPTALRCLGGPQAEELPGRAHQELCPGVLAGPSIPRWSTGAAGLNDGTLVSEEQLEQIRALGYTE